MQKPNREMHKSVKSKVLDRDKNKCIRCGKSATAVHHILPREYFPENRNEVTNIVSVCSTCHTFIHNQYGEPLTPTIDWFIQRYYYALRVPLLKK